MENKTVEPPTPGAKVADDIDDENGCVKWCFDEFDPNNMTLEYDKPPDFVTSQWKDKPKVYIVYRVLVALILPIWVIGDMMYESTRFYKGETWRWFIFASNWSFTLLALSAIVQAVTSSIYDHQPYWIVDPIYINCMPVALKIQWILVNISYNSAIVVTVAYWFFMALVSSTPLLTTHMSRIKHTVNTVYVITDIMIAATPIRVYHVFFTVFLGSLYIVFNAFYYTSDGTLLPISTEGFGGQTYYFMNWTAPVEAIITCVFGVLMSGIAQMILYGLYKLRLSLQGTTADIKPGPDSELQKIKMSSDNYNSLEQNYSHGFLGDKKS